MSPRIEANGIILKPSGSGWVVGRARPRTIKGKLSEEIVEPSYAGSAVIALPYFLGRALGTPHDPDGKDRELIDGLGGVVPIAAPDGRLLRDPAAVLDEAIGRDSIRSFARRAGLHHTTLLGILRGADPKVSTLAKIVRAAGRRP